MENACTQFAVKTPLGKFDMVLLALLNLGGWSPDHRHAVFFEPAISGKDGESFDLRLCDEQPIKRIAVV